MNVFRAARTHVVAVLQVEAEELGPVAMAVVELVAEQWQVHSHRSVLRIWTREAVVTVDRVMDGRRPRSEGHPSRRGTSRHFPRKRYKFKASLIVL